MLQSFVHWTDTKRPDSTVPSGPRSDSRTPKQRTPEQSWERSPITTSNHVSDGTSPAPSRLASALARIKKDQAWILLERHKKHYSRHNKPKLEEQSPKLPSLSTSNSDEDRPSSPVPEELEASIYCSALEEQPPSSTDNQPTDLSFQRCSKDHTYSSAGEKCQCERDYLSDDSEGQNAGL